MKSILLIIKYKNKEDLKKFMKVNTEGSYLYVSPGISTK